MRYDQKKVSLSMDGRQDHSMNFHPLIARWFRERVGQPTDIQLQAWPRIAAGGHVLISAPTGTGKTLAAFLWALNQLITGAWPTGHTSILYISPLRALNYDIQRNLLQPLGEIKEAFAKAGKGFPEIRVLTRSGDTPQPERRRMLRHPPEILISTPESLNLLLSSPAGRSILTRLSTVILDEIHAVVGNKRGVHLMTAVERLVPQAGEFQRIALSATIRPLEAVAAFVGGFQAQEAGEGPQYAARPVTVISSAMKKKYDLRLCFSREGFDGEDKDSAWSPIAAGVKKIILQNRSTLIFVNSRRLCEMLTLRINEGEEEPLAYAHHGSLSLEVRGEVERKLKAGELRAIVATHSLELGIDIGALDEVILVQSPFSVSSAIQRVGRAGHRVGQVSRGTFFPTHSKDFLEAAVLAPAILAQDIEEVRPVLAPLDVLAQVIVSMVGVETWKINSLFSALKASTPYRDLSRRQFDLVLDMLAGRYAYSRIRELKPLVSIDRLDGTVAARKGALQVLYSSGGVIPDRGYFHLRHQETRARIGELDEEFVWEATPGDTFSLGTQNWQVQQITHNDVLVLPARARELAAPFWKAEEHGRDFHFSERIGKFLEEADGRLEDADFLASLQRERFMELPAATHLIDFLRRQKRETGCSLPHRHHLVVESVSSGPGGAPGNMVVVHTFWGGRVNRPLAMVLDAAWEARFGHRLEFYAGNDSVVLQLPHEIRGEELLSLMSSARMEPLLRKRLESSGFFGARFRECAGRALLLARSKWGERMPLWLSRLHSQKLLEAALQFDDFPVLLETWRTCLRDEFDLESLEKLWAELESGIIRWTGVRTNHPSPFAQSDWWGQVSQYMYMDDRLRGGKTSRLRESLLREVVFSPSLRPKVTGEIVREFERKRQRLSPGYSPQNSRELLDWVVERLIIPGDEWELLLEAMHRDHGFDPETMLDDLKKKLIRVHPHGAAHPFIAAREVWPQIFGNLYRGDRSVFVKPLDPLSPGEEEDRLKPPEAEGEDPSLPLGQWLQFYGPKNPTFIQETLGIDRELLEITLGDLADARKVVRGQLVTGGDLDEVCDSENFEILLRMARAERRPTFEPLGIDWLPLFLAYYQGLLQPKNSLEGLQDRIEQLEGYPAEAGVWEAEIFPARLQPYDPSWLDTLMQEGDLQWMGGEGHRVTFCFEADLDLLQEDILPGAAGGMGGEPAGDDLPSGEDVSKGAHLAALFPGRGGRYDFSTLLRQGKMDPAILAEKLWQGVWDGRVTNDAFLPLRGVILNRFRLPDRSVGEKKTRRRWRRGRNSMAERAENRFLSGHWHLTPPPEPAEDLLEVEERRKDRVRLLLDRYGIVFRELLQKELPALRWVNIFRTLRIMELSGEVLAGYFFQGIPGPQFVSSQAFHLLQDKLPQEAVYWVNASDPASVCGIQVESLRKLVPARVATTHLVYRGPQPVMLSKRNGKDLVLNVPPDDPRLPEYLGPLHHLLTRRFQPLRRIAVETINDQPAPQSPYVPALRASFEVLVDYKYVNLSRSPSPLSLKRRGLAEG